MRLASPLAGWQPDGLVDSMASTRLRDQGPATPEISIAPGDARGNDPEAETPPRMGCMPAGKEARGGRVEPFSGRGHSCTDEKGRHFLTID